MSVSAAGSSSTSIDQNLDKLKSLDISDNEVYNLIDKITSNGDFGIGDQLKLTEVMQRRSQTANMLTNLARILHETASRVISNIRA